MKALPNADEPVSNEGIATEQARLYWLQLGELLEGELSLIAREFADLTELDAAIPKPDERQLAGIVSGQGLAINKSGTWVLAADDTTPIT